MEANIEGERTAFSPSSLIELTDQNYWKVVDEVLELMDWPKKSRLKAAVEKIIRFIRISKVIQEKDSVPQRKTVHPFFDPQLKNIEHNKKLVKSNFQRVFQNADNIFR